jgi:hypothetical protein
MLRLHCILHSTGCMDHQVCNGGILICNIHYGWISDAACYSYSISSAAAFAVTFASHYSLVIRNSPTDSRFLTVMMNNSSFLHLLLCMMVLHGMLLLNFLTIIVSSSSLGQGRIHPGFILLDFLSMMVSNSDLGHGFIHLGRS